jgi:hypothetical protein
MVIVFIFVSLSPQAARIMLAAGIDRTGMNNFWCARVSDFIGSKRLMVWFKRIISSGCVYSDLNHPPMINSFSKSNNAGNSSPKFVTHISREQMLHYPLLPLMPRHG